ncbi:TetR/AcrR family transcriptional regulator [Microlunatus flavus]|uniref:DNA-binding transcriptional regulator, AcrR family n=1 Tax=Microlunatus flavus TaxID=1036181 RepID=A0A1H9GU09_9ACTN|nr:TetR/AcrR family transcriptional regulator [Microlunatus flavus]SEQ53544.1 DNA-binding transcriptional regulator, AcrR family [Microlunatus flavus]
MPRETGLRNRKKAQTRERLADVAAGLFAERGYDGVSVLDVARAADVSDQTVYNYFPAKHDLVLDRAEEIRRRYDRTVRERPEGTTPAGAIRPLVHEDVERLRTPDGLVRGQFAVLCLRSPVLRRYALEFRERQADTVAEAVLATTPGLEPLVVRAHAAALVAVVQWVSDQTGTAVVDDLPVARAADALRRAADTALDDLDRHFRALSGASAP